jgi:hypothetical protein
MACERAEHEESLEEVEGVKRCDVIASATHGRSGLERWVRGSVTERLLGAKTLPLLIVHPASVKDDISKGMDALDERPAHRSYSRFSVLSQSVHRNNSGRQPRVRAGEGRKRLPKGSLNRRNTTR